MVSVSLLLPSLIISQHIFPAVLAPITAEWSASTSIRFAHINSVCSALIILLLHAVVIIHVGTIINILVILISAVVLDNVVVFVVVVVVIIIEVVVSLVEADIRFRGRFSCSSKHPVIAQPEEVLGPGEAGEEEEEEEAVEHYKGSCLHSWAAGTTQLGTNLNNHRINTGSTIWLTNCKAQPTR